MVAHHVPLIGSHASYIKEITSFAGIMLKIASLVPIKHNHWNPGQILPHSLLVYLQSIKVLSKWWMLDQNRPVFSSAFLRQLLRFQDYFSILSFLIRTIIVTYGYSKLT